MARPERNQQGYTLIEMMITVIIIGILAALVLPAVGAGARERRKVRATHDVIRIFHRARGRAIESGQAHLVRYSASANSNKGQLSMVRGTTNRCGTATFADPVATNCATDPSLLCNDWWTPDQYEVAGGSYTIELLHTTGQSNPSTASTLGDPDFCFDGMGVMYWRIGTAGFFADSLSMPNGATTVPGGGFTFSLRTLRGGTDRGVVRRVVVPVGAEARYVQ